MHVWRRVLEVLGQPQVRARLIVIERIQSQHPSQVSPLARDPCAVCEAEDVPHR
jgi:hypothetical protein